MRRRDRAATYESVLPLEGAEPPSSQARTTARVAILGPMDIVQNRPGTTPGGVTGRGFMPGQSGNPGGRPQGLARRVRDLVGDDGRAIADFMFDVMTDETARTADRLDAGRWLGDRAFGRSIQGLDIDVGARPVLDLTPFSSEDLRMMLAIIRKYEPRVDELASSGAIAVEAQSPVSRQR